MNFQINEDLGAEFGINLLAIVFNVDSVVIDEKNDKAGVILRVFANEQARIDDKTPMNIGKIPANLTTTFTDLIAAGITPNSSYSAIRLKIVDLGLAAINLTRKV